MREREGEFFKKIGRGRRTMRERERKSGREGKRQN
jgi:hypothetical protein